MGINKKMFIDPRSVLGGGKKEEFDLRRLEEVYQDLTGYLQMPVERISEDYWHKKETTDKEQQQSIEKAGTGQTVIEYYKSTPQYLYELGLWEAQKDKQREFKKIYLFCQRFNVKKILDFGGGIGGLCLYLNRRGLECDYLDVPGRTCEFAQWRFARHKIEPKVIDGLGNDPVSGYEAVIAYDVFEHLFDLDGVLKKINGYLKNGGYLISKSTFSGGGIHLKKNEVYQDLREFNALLSANGFDFTGQLKADRFSRILNKIGFKYVLFSTGIRKRLKHGGNFIIHRKR